MLQRIDSKKRLILVTGKGGVGKTTVAAAIARAAAARGRKVLLADIADDDLAESPLGRVVGHKFLSPKPHLLEPNLWVGHLHARTGHEGFLKSVLPAGPLVRAAVRSRAISRFLSAAPSFHEMGIYYHMLSLLKETDKQGRLAYDLMVLDMPATGHALALTSLVDILLALIPGGPVRKALLEGDAIARNPETAATVVVTLPEKLPVSESIELVQGLRETDMPIGGVVINKMPADPLTPAEHAAIDSLVEERRVLGSRRLIQIRESQKAADRLTESTELPTLTLPDHRKTAAELLDALTADIGRAWELA